MICSPSAHAQSFGEQIVHSFKGGNADGSIPGNLITVNGMIYGTTTYGGTYSNGTVYSFDPTTHATKVIYSFGTNGSTDGASPTSLIDVNGTLYGTTSMGGTNNHGTVFSIDETTQAEKILYSFSGTDLFGANADGNSPSSVIDVNGTLYGTAYKGGTHAQGTVFSINETTNAETTLHSFSSFGSPTDGSYLLGGLINVNGTLYGTTVSGGTYGAGTVFSINPTTNAESLVYSFNCFNGEGNGPVASLLYVNGVVYGTTQYGGATNLGTVFSVDLTTHTGKVLHSFHAAANDGDRVTPLASLLAVNGTLYGTSQNGGAFSINPDGTGYTMLYNFTSNSSDGSSPASNLVNINSILYGTTLAGGSYGSGTVYSLTSASGLPVAANDSYSTKYKSLLTGAAPGVLGNDTNGGAGSLTAALVAGPTHGTLSLKSDGSFTYTPAAGFAGTDSFTYQAVNSVGSSNVATCVLTVTSTVPTAVSHVVNVKYNTTLTNNAPGVLGNVDNGGSSPMTASLVTNVTHGTLTLNSNGGFVYTPTTGFTGTDSFTYQAVNSVGKSNVATTYLIVSLSAPTAVNHYVNVKHNTTLIDNAPGVLGNVSDGGSSPMTAILVTGPSHGSLTLNANGGFVYTPTTGFTGTDSFTYQAKNAVGTSNTATTTLTVQ